MAKGRMVWLARDRAGYSIHSRKPRWDAGYYIGWQITDGFCVPTFQRITGYKLNPGECKRVRIRVEEA